MSDDRTKRIKIEADKIFEETSEDTTKDVILYASFVITILMLFLSFSIFMLIATYGFISLLWIFLFIVLFSICTYGVYTFLKIRYTKE